MRRAAAIACAVFALTSLTGSALTRGEQAGDAPVPSAEHGAVVFQGRCVLCHGGKGMGEGALPLSLPDYPPTSLIEPGHGDGLESVRQAVIWGGSRGDMNAYMPPWGGELTWQEIESVSQFVVYLRTDTEAALAMLDRHRTSAPPSKKAGRVVYLTRCALCHGRNGEGDGKMARLLKDPPPYDLTASRMPEEYLRMIIGGGGESVGRSPKMPPWGEELSAGDLESVILHLKTLRD